MQPPIGMTLPVRDDRPRSEVTELVQRVEQLGYDSVWLGESWGREVFSSMAHIVCNTTRLRVAAGIANVFSRTPALVAQSIATVDEISGGRAILGLGSSGEKVIRDWHGVPFEKPLARTREYIEIVNMALSGHRVNYDGQFYQMRDFRIGFNPIRDHVPVYLAALGPKNIETTGELADGWAPIYLSQRRMPEFRRLLQVGTEKAGRKVEDIVIRPYSVACVSRDPEEAKQHARGHVGFYIGGMGRYYHDLIASYGYQEECARVKEAFQRRDREGAASAVTDAMLDELCIVGTPEQCRQTVMDRVDAGMGYPVLYIPHSAPREMVRETVEALAPTAFR